MNLLIVGAGAAGLMAAGAALESGHAVTLLEHSGLPGKKILVLSLIHISEPTRP